MEVKYRSILNFNFMSDVVKQRDFDSSFECLYFDWLQKSDALERLGMKLERMPVVAADHLEEWDRQAREDEAEAPGLFKIMIGAATEELISSKDRAGVLMAIRNQSFLKHGDILAAIEAKLTEELRRGGVDVDKFIAEQPEVMRTGLADRALRVLAGVLDYAKSAVIAQKREDLLPKLAGEVSRVRSAGRAE